jgi:hypothetical protein
VNAGRKAPAASTIATYEEHSATKIIDQTNPVVTNRWLRVGELMRIVSPLASRRYCDCALVTFIRGPF